MKIIATVYIIISTDIWSRALKTATEELVFLGENVTDKCTLHSLERNMWGLVDSESLVIYWEDDLGGV